MSPSLGLNLGFSLSLRLSPSPGRSRSRSPSLWILVHFLKDKSTHKLSQLFSCLQ